MIMDALCRRTEKITVAKNSISFIEIHLYPIQVFYMQSGTPGGERPIGGPFHNHQPAVGNSVSKTANGHFLKNV